jgi:hypothetical protein
MNISMHSLWRRLIALPGALIALFVLSACGGSPDAAPPASWDGTGPFAVWTGNVNSDVVLDGSGQMYKVSTSTPNTVYSATLGVWLSLRSDTRGNLYDSNGTQIGSITLDSAKVAKMRCLDSSLMTLTVATNNWSYSCAGTSGGGGSGGGSGGGVVYVTWTGNTLGSTVRDGAGSAFAVRLSDRAVIAMPGNTQLTGLTVDAQANVQLAGTGAIGSVTLDASSVAVLRCSSGTTMILSVGTSWSHNCGSSSGGGGGGSGGGGSAVTWRNWSGNSLGTVLLDGTDRHFSVLNAPGQANDSALYDLASATPMLMTGLTVDNTGAILLNGAALGSVTLDQPTGQPAVMRLRCSTGTNLVFIFSGTGWSHNCGSGTVALQTYLPIAGNVNGTVIFDGANQQFSIRAADNAVVDLNGLKVLAGLTVNPANNYVYKSGSRIGQIDLVAAASPATGQVAVLDCFSATSPPPRMSISYSATGWSDSCSGTAGGAADLGYVSWSPNAASSPWLVADAVAGHAFAVRATDNVVIDLSNPAQPVALTGLTVDSTGAVPRVLKSGQAIGQLGYDAASKVQLQCSGTGLSARPMTLTVTATGWRFGC